MTELFKKYVEEFNSHDDELYKNDIPNSEAYEWLAERIPLFECSDKEIEKTYYFRWWTYRKHIKSTPDGYAITEFLPNVPWAGKHNIINAPAGHHFYEGRWLRNSDKIFSDYLRYYLNNPEDSHRYSVWLLNAAVGYESAGGELSIGKEELSKMVEYYAEWERTHGHKSGMFWSVDDRDAMEYSVSGRRDGKAVKGIRPTLNSYMYAEAKAICYFAKKLGESIIAEQFENKAEKLKRLINENLLSNGFYFAKHGDTDEELDRILEREVSTDSPVELIGYIPHMFGIPEDKSAECFKYLLDSEIFLAKTGMTTVDKRHPDYLKSYNHECLWNGYVWPFATSQVLTGLIKTIHGGHPELKDILIRHLELYAYSHRIDLDGKILPWIDEVMSPNELKWTSREILRDLGWQERLGGRERGKDYNHSTFADLIITGIVGVKTDSETLELDPAIPDGWDYMKLENLSYRGKLYTVVYDKTGEKYGFGKGITVLEN